MTSNYGARSSIFQHLSKYRKVSYVFYLKLFHIFLKTPGFKHIEVGLVLDFLFLLVEAACSLKLWWGIGVLSQRDLIVHLVNA